MLPIAQPSLWARPARSGLLTDLQRGYMDRKPNEAIADDRLTAQVEAEARVALRRLVLARWAFLGLCLAMLGVWAGPGQGPGVLLAMVSLLVPFAVYNLWLTRRLKRGRIAPWLNYVNVTIDLLLVSLYLLSLSYRNSPLDMVTSSVNLVYLLVLLYAAFRLDKRLLLFTLALTLACANTLYFWRLHGLAPELLAAAPTLGPWGQLARSLIMLIFGLGLWLIPRTVRNLLGRQAELFSAHQNLEERYRQDLEREVAEKTAELSQANRDLQKALTEVKTLRGLLPICARCKKIRDEAGQWHAMETYLSARTAVNITHGLCEDCFAAIYPEITQEVMEHLKELEKGK
ncbi:MAG: hypothetical protein V1797_14665 [Pseudomonadota bacterium]